MALQSASFTPILSLPPHVALHLNGLLHKKWLACTKSQVPVVAPVACSRLPIYAPAALSTHHMHVCPPIRSVL